MHSADPNKPLSENRNNFYADNFSYVGYFPTGSKAIPAMNFAFTYNRLKNLNRRYTVAGQDKSSSLTDYIATITNGIPVADMNASDSYDPYANNNVPWLSTLGWLGYLINDAPNDTYTGLFAGEAVEPRLHVSERGHIESYDLSLSTYIADQLYLGVTASMTDISYRMNSSYGETFRSGGTIALHNEFETDASGIHLAAGVIWRPLDFLRVGVAYHSPTWYYATDYYQGRTDANYAGVNNDWAKTPDNAWTRYRFNTPGSWVFSAAGVIGSKAIISVDYELKNYAQMRLMNHEGFAKSRDNQFIREDFRNTSTLRAGAEYRVTPQFSVRAGYAYSQSPYEKQFAAGQKQAMIVGTVPHYTLDGDTRYYTCGLGYRFSQHFYLDVALVHRSSNDKAHYFPTVVGGSGAADILVPSPATSLKSKQWKGLVTIGCKF
jgi:opacity protein-like surface antigen